MIRISKKTARRLAWMILAVPVLAWGAFLAWMAYSTHVSIPESVEYAAVVAFVRESDEVAKEFGNVMSISAADRHRVRILGGAKSGMFSLHVTGDRSSGTIEAEWEFVTSINSIRVLSILRQAPFKTGTRIYP